MSRGLPSPGSPQSQFNANRVNLPGYSEVIWNPLYDYQTKSSSATAQQRFFLEPQGGASNKTLVDTNMTLAGQIPKGQAFLITGIEVDFFPGEDPLQEAVDNDFINDVYAFYKTGALILTIGSKDYVQQAPLMKFPPSHRLAVDAAAATTATTTTIEFAYATACGREFAIRDLLLESNQNFNVTLINMPALPSAVDGRVGVTLNGFLYRNAQ